MGIPTVGDRIAQGVVKDYLEPSVDAIFHNSSFGYRPGRSAHDALVQCQANCIQKPWVLDVDIKGFFDNISHSILLELLGLHTQEKWVLMYDTYGVEPHNFGFCETTDFEKFTPIGRFNEGVMKTVNFASPKHDAVMHLTAAEARRLADHWKLERY